MNVRGGDNEIDSYGTKVCFNCTTGETPWQYHVVTLNNQVRTYQIQQLVTGTEYYVRLSASNARGFGAHAVSYPVSIIPPYQVRAPCSCAWWWWQTSSTADAGVVNVHCLWILFCLIVECNDEDDYKTHALFRFNLIDLI